MREKVRKKRQSTIVRTATTRRYCPHSIHQHFSRPLVETMAARGWQVTTASVQGFDPEVSKSTERKLHSRKKRMYLTINTTFSKDFCEVAVYFSYLLHLVHELQTIRPTAVALFAAKCCQNNDIFYCSSHGLLKLLSAQSVSHALLCI